MGADGGKIRASAPAARFCFPTHCDRLAANMLGCRDTAVGDDCEPPKQVEPMRVSQLEELQDELARLSSPLRRPCRMQGSIVAPRKPAKVSRGAARPSAANLPELAGISVAQLYPSVSPSSQPKARSLRRRPDGGRGASFADISPSIFFSTITGIVN